MPEAPTPAHPPTPSSTAAAGAGAAPGSTHPLRVAWEGLTLAGDLHLPGRDGDGDSESDRDPDGPTPAIVMVQGSGPSDRDSNGYFLPIRRALLGRGVAVASVDKPGCGSSTGDWHDHGLEERAAAAEAVLDAVADAMPGSPVGYFGHSQGAWVGQILAARRPDLALAVLSSGPSIGVAAQDRFALEERMRADGDDPATIAEALAHLDALHAAAIRGDDFATVAALEETVRDRPWHHLHRVEDAADWRLARLLVARPHDPIAHLARARCPVLAVFGGRDVLVPAWSGATEVGRALQAAGRTDAAVVVHPEGDHRLLVPGTDRFVTGYLDTMTGWVADRFAEGRDEGLAAGPGAAPTLGA